MTPYGTERLNLASSPAALENSQTTPGGGFIATGEAAVSRVQLIATLSALSLEAVGMKRRGRSVLSIVREHYGIRARTAKAAHEEFRRLLASRGIVHEDSGSVINTVAVFGALAATVVIVALSSARLEPETVAALVAFATHPVILGGIVSAAFLGSAVRRLRS